MGCSSATGFSAGATDRNAPATDSIVRSIAPSRSESDARGATKSEAKESVVMLKNIASDQTRSAYESDKLAATVSATGRDASGVRRSITTKLEASEDKTSASQLPTVGFAGLKTVGKSRVESLELAEFGAELMAAKATKVESTTEPVVADRNIRNNVKLAWLEAQSESSPSQVEAKFETVTVESNRSRTVKKLLPARIDHPFAGTSDSKLHLRGDYVVQFKPVSKLRGFTEPGVHQASKGQKSKLELNVGKVSSGGIKESENIEGRFTNASQRPVDSSKAKDNKDRNPESLLNVKSPEKKESDLGKRLCNYDLESEKNYDDEGKRKTTYKERIKTISAKIIHPCIETIKMVIDPSSGGEGSSEESSSSAKTSVVTTEETDLSDDNQTSICTNSQSAKHVTARKISSDNTTVVGAEFENKDEFESPDDKVRTITSDISSRDENLVKGTTSSGDRSPDSLKPDRAPDSLKPVESESEKRSVIVKVKDGKPISEEFSEIQTSEDNLSPLEYDDDDNLAVHVRKTISTGEITFHENYRASSQESLTSSEEHLPSLEENLLTPENEIQKKSEVKTVKDKNVDKLTKSDGRRKHGLTSSEESIALTKSKSESETDTKESWVDYRSESTTASKKGLTSSEEVLTSERGGDSKKKNDDPKSSEEISPIEIIRTEAIDIPNRDRIQNLISDTKTVMSRVPANGILKLHPCEEKLDEKELPNPPPIELSESEESGISGDTDSSSTVEIKRISERLLPIEGTLTLIKGKPPSDRSTPPSWGSLTSILESLTWEKRNAAENEPSDRSVHSSISTLHRETPIQELMHLNKTPQKCTTWVSTVDEIKSLQEKQSSDTDSSSEETLQHKKITCEQVINQMQSASEDVVMTAHYCIDSITFGIRRSLSEEKLYSFEADTQAHKEKKTSGTKIPSAAPSLPYKACDACTFLVLLQTLIVRERVIHFAFRKVDACLVHNIGLDSEFSHIYSYLLKRMPLCDICTFPSVEQMILQLVQSRHGLLMHKAENLAPIYVIFPPYAENNRTIGRVVHLRKKKVPNFGKKARIRVMMADRYILFPKHHDSSIWTRRTSLKRHDTPTKRQKVKSRNVPAKMDDIPELNESIAEESRPKVNVEHKTSKDTSMKKRSSKRKARKCVLKKWSVQMTGSNVNRRNGSSSDEPISPNVIPGAKSASTNAALSEQVALNNKRRRCVLKKWTVNMSPKSKRKSIYKSEEQNLSSNDSTNLSEVAVLPTKTKAKPTTTKLKTSSTSQFLEHTQIDGVVLVRKKRPWWKCPKKKTRSKKKPTVDPKKRPDFYKKILQPTHQQPLSYTIKSRTTGQLQTRALTRQDLMAQRLAYHYIRKLTVGRKEPSPREDEIKVIKPSLTDFQSREYEKRRTFIRGSRVSEPRTSGQAVQDQDYYDEECPDEELASDEPGPESPLDISKYDLSQFDYHFENCPIIQSGDIPYKKFLKLQQVNKTTDFEDSWVEYHVEDCSYFIIDGTTVTDIKFVYLVLAEKKDDICDCAEKLIKGGNIYHKDKTSHTFHHDLCLLFPRQLESGNIDLQGLFNPNIPSREFDENDVIRFYFISKRSDTKDPRLIDYLEIPISKFNEAQESIKSAYSVLSHEVETMMQVYAREDNESYEESASSEIASTSTQLPLKTYQREDSDDTLRSAVCPQHVELAEYQRYLSPPRVDSESEDSTTVYSLEDCLIYASERMTDDSMSPPPDSLGGSDNQSVQNLSVESIESGHIRQFTPSPRPVDQAQDDKSVDHHGSATLSPRQGKDEGQIYYHLGEFTTQIQKGLAIDQRIASPRPLEIKDDNAACVCKPGPSGQKLLSPPTSLREIVQIDREDQQKHEEPTRQQFLSPKVGERSEEYMGRIQPQAFTSGQRVIPSRQMAADSLRLGHSLDSIQRRRLRSQEKMAKDFETQSLCLPNQDSMRDHRVISPRQMSPHNFGQEICSEGNSVQGGHISQRDHCKCNLSKSLEIYEHVVDVVAYLEGHLKKSLCEYHGTFYDKVLAKPKRTFSQGDLSHPQRLSVFCPELTSDQKGASARPTETYHRQSSYPPFQRTRASSQRSESQDVTNSTPSIYRQYSLDAVVSPTRIQDSLGQVASSAGTSFEQSRITDQHTRSHGDLRSKRSLSLRNQEYVSNRDVSENRPAEQLFMKAVVSPTRMRGIPRRGVSSAGMSFDQGRVSDQRTQSHSDLRNRRSLSLYNQEFTCDDRDETHRQPTEQLCVRGVYIRSQENATEGVEFRSLNQGVSPSNTEDLSGMYSGDLAQGEGTDSRETSLRMKRAEDECRRLWKLWREDPPPF